MAPGIKRIDRMKQVIVAGNILHGIGLNDTLLGRSGIIVVPASSSEEILSLHRDRQADLIVTEYSLPLMGGAQLCSVIRSEAVISDVSIIVVCERKGSAAAQSQQSGASAILLKPLDCVELFDKVSHLLVVQDRAAVRIPLRITVRGRGTQSAFIGVSRDISVSGMLLESVGILQQGDRLECSFTLRSHVVSVECIVIRVPQGRREDVPVRKKFLNLDTKTFVLLENLIRSGGET